eukprot:Skav205930  [mRNA]  locus=scaffold2739:23288:24878:- [translate_table: standard]
MPVVAHVTDEQHQRLVEAPECLLSHGWPVRPAVYDEYLGVLASIPEPEGVVLSADECGDKHVFVDGACTVEADKRLRVASWACTCAGGQLLDRAHELLAAGVVPGLLQTAYRGELWATYTACLAIQDLRCAVTLWSDNGAVVYGLRKLLRGKKVRPNRPHRDLWDKIAAVVARIGSRLRVCKVLSHADLDRATDECEQWAFWHNAIVDGYAHLANQTRGSAFQRLWQQVKEALDHQRQDLKAVLQVHLRTARASLYELPKPDVSTEEGSVSAVHVDEPEGTADVPRRALEVTAHDNPAVGSGIASGSSQHDRVFSGGGEDPNISTTQREAETSVESRHPPLPGHWSWSPKVGKQVGDKVFAAIRRWWIGSMVPMFSGRTPLLWISGFQLYLDYAASMQTAGPVYHDRKWFSSADDVDGQYDVLHLVRGFTGLLRWFLEENSWSLDGAHTRCAGASLAMRMACYRLPFPQEKVDWLDQHVFGVRGCQITKLQQLKDAPVPKYPPQWILPR